MTLRALDLFCGAGGASMGLHRAGFEVVGVDIKPQPHYVGDHFFQADALTFPLDGYDLVWASCPCEFASRLTAGHRHKHANLIPATRARLRATGTPYIIENVADAREHLINPVMLCGTMFGLPLWRHRFFETSFGVGFPPTCKHDSPPVVVSGSPRRRRPDGTQDRTEPSTQERRDAMEIAWMSRTELDKAIPPAYSEWLARQLISVI